MGAGVGVSVYRKDAWPKVTGEARFTGDEDGRGLVAYLVTSSCAHGLIARLDPSPALAMAGVRAVVTGADAPPILTGSMLEDRPLLARERVRYFGEPVAIVVADSEREAKRGAEAVRVEYAPLPVVHTVEEALEAGAPLIHAHLASYRRADPETRPVPGTNIAHEVRIRKGDTAQGWAASAVAVEGVYALSQADHAYLEPRCVRAEVTSDGEVVMETSSQAPFVIQRELSEYFGLPEQSIRIRTPFVGGAFGGKTAVQLEPLAYLAARAVKGRPVTLITTREQDMTGSPARVGLKARIRLGATPDGRIVAADLVYLVDVGAYSDLGARITRAIACDGTGPYAIPHVRCDSLSVYTNKPYAVSFRGFGHLEYAFCIERTMDKLARALGMDPVEVRRRNAIAPGDTSPTQMRCTASDLGNVAGCVERAKELIGWESGSRRTAEGKVRAKGFACLWKNSSSPTDASAGAIITFNADGTVNLNTGTVEMGQGAKMALAQIVAERLKLDVRDIHVNVAVDTSLSPEHWKTVASKSTYLAGRATLAAADDARRQLRAIAAVALRVAPDDLEVGGGRVYLRGDPAVSVDFPAIVHGYKYPGGNAVGGQVIGRGTFIMPRLTYLEPETGRGRPGPGWTVGAQAVEVEYDPRNFTYEVLRAVTVMDIGRTLNPALARGVVNGGVAMGLSLASREIFEFTERGAILDPNFRTYGMLRFGEQPEYQVEFLETPERDSPYGARGLGEDGIIGIPAALANSLSAAAGVDFDALPLTPERLWRTQMRAGTGP